MPRLTPDPDPVFDRLAGFTPAPALDPAEVLFRAGRASARTPRGWKLLAGGLVLLNLGTAALLLARRTPDPVRVEVPVPVVAPDPGGGSDPLPAGADRLPMRTTDPDQWPHPQPAGRLPPDDPLTLLAARGLPVD